MAFASIQSAWQTYSHLDQGHPAWQGRAGFPRVIGASGGTTTEWFHTHSRATARAELRLGGRSVVWPILVMSVFSYRPKIGVQARAGI